MSELLCMKPGRIGPMELRNRIVFPPMITNMCELDGRVTDRFIAYHEARARGGVGLICTGGAYISLPGKSMANQLGIHSDDMIPGLRRLADAVHRQGAKISVQLFHGGRQTMPALNGGYETEAPSRVKCAWSDDYTRELSRDEIRELVLLHGQAARRAREAGFDCIDVHGAHGYLINQFLSCYMNKRTDEYGGSLENRMRFLREVVREVRSQVGDDMAINFRVCGIEGTEGGTTPEEACAIVRAMVGEGVNAVNVSAGNYEALHLMIPPAAMPYGWNLERARMVREAVNGAIPVIAAGRIKTVDVAEKALSEGCADFVAMGRALIADPELPNKAKEGRADAVRPCIGCNEGCVGRLAVMQQPVTCTVNPAAGRELEIRPAEKKLEVVVVGAGPVGMTAALYAVRRGHRVTVFEKEDKPGGQLNLADKPPFKSELGDYAAWQARALNASGVSLLCSRNMTAHDIEAIRPDVVLLATGALPLVPPLPGVNDVRHYMAQDILSDAETWKKKLSRRIVVIGGGLIGCETAELLTDAGHKVTVIEMRDDMAPDAEMMSRGMMMQRFAEKGVTCMPKTRVTGMENGALRVEGPEGEKILGAVDDIVIAVGSKPCNPLEEPLKKRGIRVIVIGDAVNPGKILAGNESAFQAVCSL